MKRTRLLAPYKADGSTAFPARQKRGVYLIYRRRMLGDPKLVYVGYSGTDVYKTMYRHFQEWNDRQARLGQREDRITYTPAGSYLVRVIYTRTKLEAQELERALILKYQPKDNPDKLELYEITKEGLRLVQAAEDAAFVADVIAPF